MKLHTDVCLRTENNSIALALLSSDDVFITMRDAVIKLIYDEKTRDKVAGLLLSHLFAFSRRHRAIQFTSFISSSFSRSLKMIINNLNCFRLVHINQ
jgi:hypothetical protein